MGKLISFVIFLIALQATLLIFEGSTPEDTSLWALATHPGEWNSLSVIVTIVGVAAALGAAAIIIGAVLGIKTDFMIFAVMIAALISFGAVIVNFGGVIGKYACSMFCEIPDLDVAGATWATCPPAVWIVAITAGALGAYYIFTVLDWWRGKD